MKLYKPFSANYLIVPEAELPSSGQEIMQFKYGVTEAPSHGLSGLLARIEANGESPWLALFGDGYQGGEVLDAIYTTPMPNTVSVISKGAGYLVNTVNKTKQDVPVFPIRHARALSDLLVFADFTKLAAFGVAGIRWVTGRVVSDKLTISESAVNAKTLFCTGLDASTQEEVEVEVDMATGNILGRKHLGRSSQVAPPHR